MNARLLVIDDEAMVRDSLVAYLEDSGYEIVSAESGLQGLELLKQQVFDLVLCDLRMPQLDGLDVLKRIKDISPNTPFIVVSGAGVMNDVVQALRLGASDYLVKPIIDMAVLDHSIQKTLSIKRLEADNQQYRDHLEAANRQLSESLDELRSDQQAGRQVQAKMLPEPLQNDHYQFSHLIKPSLMLSGDFLDYFLLDEHHYGFYIADVSGHGAASAFVTVLLKNLTYRLKRNLKRGSSDDLFYPVKVLERINQELLDTDCGKHLTIVYCVLNTQSLQLNYSIGAHMPLPILYANGEAQYLSGKGMPVGLFRDAKYNNYQLQMPDSFSINLFSDGILELLKQPSLALKEEYLRQLVEDNAGDHESIKQALYLNNDDDIPDDVALMTIVRV